MFAYIAPDLPRLIWGDTHARDAALQGDPFLPLFLSFLKTAPYCVQHESPSGRRQMQNDSPVSFCQFGALPL